jgi:ribosomal-protein-alanine N-acetyltransferase
MIPIETPRLRLRDFDERDFAAIHAYGTDPEVVRYLPWGPNDEAETRDFLLRVMDEQAQQPRTSYELAVTLKETGRLIGGAALWVTSSEHAEGEIGYCYHRDAWGHGYAVEAARALLPLGFRTLGLHRLFGRCVAENTASARVLEKLGMQYEGLLRDSRWEKGQWLSYRYYALLEPEWEP